MGACLSCLRARQKAGADTDEHEPLLANIDEQEADLVADAVDQQTQQRQQDVAHIVDVTRDYFVDIPNVESTDAIDSNRDVSALKQTLESRLDNIEM